jgi:hypothetical protein
MSGLSGPTLLRAGPIQGIHVFLHPLLRFVRPMCAGLLAGFALQPRRDRNLGGVRRCARGDFEFQRGAGRRQIRIRVAHREVAVTEEVVHGGNNYIVACDNDVTASILLHGKVRFQGNDSVLNIVFDGNASRPSTPRICRVANELNDGVR